MVSEFPDLKFAMTETYEYDRDLGEIQRSIDGMVREHIQIRQGLIDLWFAKQVAAELRRLGWVVIEPSKIECPQCRVVGAHKMDCSEPYRTWR